MTRQLLLTCARVATVALAIREVAASATCYYPDGSEAASSESPCSSADGSACCPDNWTCLDNGLCHYAVNNLYGAYSCTDQSWKAAGCPSNLCTYNMTRVGGESITQCNTHNNDWCCNADAVHVDCCAESPSPRPFFELASGSAYATVGTSTASSAPTLASITGLASGSASASASGEAVSSTGAASGSSSLAQSSGSGSNKGSSATPITSQFTSVSSGTAGIQTVVITSVIEPAETSTSGAAASSTSPSHNHTGLIVGCAVGVPLALALAGILIWLCHKRRQQKTNPYDAPPDAYGNGDTSTLNDSPEFAGGAKLHKKEKSGLPVYKNEMPGVSELPGQSVGPGRPISTIPGRAELQSGAAFAPGTTPHAPHLVGVGGGTGNTPPTSSQGGSSWGSAPPGYSPGMNQQAWQGPHDGAVEADGTAVPGHAAAAANVTEGGRYIPYRPPPGHAAATGNQLQNVPETAEMSAVRTPPAE